MDQTAPWTGISITELLCEGMLNTAPENGLGEGGSMFHVELCPDELT